MPEWKGDEVMKASDRLALAKFEEYGIVPVKYSLFSAKIQHSLYLPF